MSITSQFRRIDNTAKVLHEVSFQMLADNDPDRSYLEQEGFEERLAEYRNGTFAFIGIRAKAVFSLRGVMQTIYSGGIYGVEDDSGHDYLKSLAMEEAIEIRSILNDLGFSDSEILSKQLEF